MAFNGFSQYCPPPASPIFLRPGLYTENGWGPTLEKTPERQNAPSRTPSAGAFFCFLSRLHFRSFFLCLGVLSCLFLSLSSLSGGLLVEFWWLFEAPGPSNVHVWALAGRRGLTHREKKDTRRPSERDKKRHEKTPRERKQERKWERERGKKARNFSDPHPSSPHPSGPNLRAPHPLSPPLFPGFGLHPSGPPSGLPTPGTPERGNAGNVPCTDPF